jgi:hypothetical protein
VRLLGSASALLLPRSESSSVIQPAGRELKEEIQEKQKNI